MDFLRRFHFLCWCLSCASASSSSTAAQDVEFTLVPAAGAGPNAQPEQLRIEHSASRLTLHVPTPIDKSGSY